MKNKILSLILCLCLFSCIMLSLTSCKERDREYNEAEVLAAAKALIEKNKILEEIYYGAGIRYIEDEEKEGIYRLADPAHLAELYEKHGIKDIKTLKKKTEEVHSKAGCAVRYSLLQNVVGDTSIVSYARYYESEENEDVGSENGLMVNIRAEDLYKNSNTESVEFIYDGMRVSAVNGEIVTVSLKVKTTGTDKTTDTRDFTVNLIEEENGWRLNSVLFAAHKPQQVK